ncbi:hypothetical protein ACJX0J_037922, partial [Zea mays]
FLIYLGTFLLRATLLGFEGQILHALSIVIWDSSIAQSNQSLYDIGDGVKGEKTQRTHVHHISD